MTARERRPPIFGPEPWADIAGVEWCHFDVWFALVTTADFDADADALRGELEATLQSTFHRRDEMQAKLSHLADLRSRLDAAGLSFVDLVGAEEPDKQLLAKARRKVLDQALEGRAMTEPARVNLLEVDFVANHCVVAGSSFGSLIHTASGSAGGWGGLRTNRSGCAAYAELSTTARWARSAWARP